MAKPLNAGPADPNERCPVHSWPMHPIHGTDRGYGPDHWCPACDREG